ncbi:MAG: 23S rRNA pseudouridine(2604) synthase RluF [Flavobacteriales bacterium]|nr:23S rRNA pseudouridine(2604) synthase RluF [Flavobacteriales bacterium]
MEDAAPKGMRLNKALSAAGYCSRREADRLIEQGVVTINDRPATLGDRVTETDRIEVRGRPINTAKAKPVYIALHKPRGIICSTDPKARDNIVDYIDHVERIFPVGRLDVASEGLILMTNDGDIINKILRARYAHEKEYIVRVDKPITDEFIKGMASGVPILDAVTRECEVEKLSEDTFRIILTQGLNRQIRRMCEHFEYEVTRLRRIRIMNISLDGIRYGEWRDLTATELKELKSQLVD